MKQVKMKVNFIDVWSMGNGHEIINTSMLAMLLKIFNNIKFFANENYYLLLTKNLEIFFDKATINKSIIHKNAIRKGKGKWRIKTFIGTINEIFIFLTGEKKDIYFFTSINVFSTHIINFMSKISGKKTFILCHSMEELEKIKSTNIIENIRLKILHRIFFKLNVSNNLYFIVLGESIKNNMSKLNIPQKTLDHIISIEHPYYFSEFNLIDTNVDKKHINLGIISHLKDYDTLCKINSLLNKYERIKVWFLSYRYASLDFESLNNIFCVGKAGTQLDRDIYLSYIQNMDYIFFFYPADSYKFTASGAVFEALMNKKTIITQPNDYFNHLFSEFGAFGCQYNNIEELEIIFNKLQNNRFNVEFDNLIFEKAINYLNPLNYSEIFMQKIKSVLENAEKR